MSHLGHFQDKKYFQINETQYHYLVVATPLHTALLRMQDNKYQAGMQGSAVLHNRVHIGHILSIKYALLFSFVRTVVFSSTDP